MTSLKSIINPKSCSVLPQKFYFQKIFQIQKKTRIIFLRRAFCVLRWPQPTLNWLKENIKTENWIGSVLKRQKIKKMVWGKFSTFLECILYSTILYIYGKCVHWKVWEWEYYLSNETMRFSTHIKRTLSIFQYERATLSWKFGFTNHQDTVLKINLSQLQYILPLFIRHCYEIEKFILHGSTLFWKFK